MNVFIWMIVIKFSDKLYNLVNSYVLRKKEVKSLIE